MLANEFYVQSTKLSELNILIGFVQIITFILVALFHLEIPGDIDHSDSEDIGFMLGAIHTDLFPEKL